MTMLEPGVADLRLLIAHPDDEVIFFYNTLRWLAPQRLRLICLTGRFGPDTAVRRAELTASAEALGAELCCLDLEDAPRQPLDPTALERALWRVRGEGPLLTHGPLGDYGHAHHMDAFLSALRVDAEAVWCLAGPLDAHVTPPRGAAWEQASTLARRYPSQARVHEWIGVPERLCHVVEDRHGRELVALARGEGLPVGSDVSGLSARLGGEMPMEAAKVAYWWNEDGVRLLVSGCRSRWSRLMEEA